MQRENKIEILLTWFVYVIIFSIHEYGWVAYYLVQCKIYIHSIDHAKKKKEKRIKYSNVKKIFVFSSLLLIWVPAHLLMVFFSFFSRNWSVFFSHFKRINIVDWHSDARNFLKCIYRLCYASCFTYAFDGSLKKTNEHGYVYLKENYTHTNQSY